MVCISCLGLCCTVTTSMIYESVWSMRGKLGHVDVDSRTRVKEASSEGMSK